MNERQWIHAIQKGEKKYFQDIAEKYYDDIFRFCAFQTGSREDAYDLAQETFLRFIRYVESYHDHNLKGYLLTISMNVCRNYLSKKAKERAREIPWDSMENPQLAGRWVVGEPAAPAAESLASQKGECYADQAGSVSPGIQESFACSEPERYSLEADVHNALMEALAQLPGMQREAVLLYYLYEMKYREIGHLTGVSVSTVKSRVRQGMDKLRTLLKREDFFEG